MRCSIVIRYVFTCGIDRTQSTLTEHWKGRGLCRCWHGGRELSVSIKLRPFVTPFHSVPPLKPSLPPLTRQKQAACLPAFPPLSLSSRHSKWSRHFICLHGNWNCQLPPLSLSPLTAFDPFRGGDQRPSDDGRQIAATKCPLLLPPNHTPHQVS